MNWRATAIIALALSVAAVRAIAESRTDCRIVRSEGASFLEKCGDQLRSFSLSFSDIRRTRDHDWHGRFYFPCSIELMCVNAPVIAGNFIAPAKWRNGPKDERAIFDAMHQVPQAAATWSGPADSPLQPSAAACPMFDVSIGDMSGRAVCVNDANMKGSAVVVVASDDYVGVVLTFYHPDHNASELLGEVSAIIPRFKTERAVGDAALMRWLK